MSGANEVEAPTPPPCPAWCSCEPGHDYTSLVVGNSKELWFTRWHESPSRALLPVSDEQNICASVAIIARELANTAGDVIVEPPRVSLAMPVEMTCLDPEETQRLASALLEAAGELEALDRL